MQKCFKLLATGVLVASGVSAAALGDGTTTKPGVQSGEVFEAGHDPYVTLGTAKKRTTSYKPVVHHHHKPVTTYKEKCDYACVEKKVEAVFDAMAAVVEAENEQCLATADGLRQEMVAEAVALRTALA